MSFSQVYGIVVGEMLEMMLWHFDALWQVVQLPPLTCPGNTYDVEVCFSCTTLRPGSHGVVMRDENNGPKAKTITNDVKRKMIAKAPAA